jgi:hypothetical protein
MAPTATTATACVGRRAKKAVNNLMPATSMRRVIRETEGSEKSVLNVPAPDPSPDVTGKRPRCANRRYVGVSQEKTFGIRIKVAAKPHRRQRRGIVVRDAGRGSPPYRCRRPSLFGRRCPALAAGSK